MKGDAMIISRSDQSYDLAEGAAAQASSAASVGTAATARQQWEEDGGPLQIGPPISPLEFSTKPTWSVLSLRDLNLAIRVGHWPDDPADLQRAAAEAERRRRPATEDARGIDDGIRRENP